jgi:signal transduction histidine kinase
MTAEAATSPAGNREGSTARRWRSSIRLRYTAIATVLAAAAVTAGGGLALSLYRNSLTSNVEQAVRAAAQQVALSARQGPLPDPIPMPVAPSVPRIEILNGSGHTLTGDPASVTAPPLDYLTRARAGHVFEVSNPVGLPDHRAAVMTLRVVTPAGLLTVIVAASLDQVDSRVDHAFVLGATLAATSLAVVAIVAWFTSGRTLRRVEKIRAQVAAITDQADLTRRVPDTASDELGQLGQTLNHMLAAIAHSSERQRRFVADAAHELRTPLAGITASLEVAAHHPQSVGSDWVTEILAGHRHLVRLVNDLLELAALDDGQAMKRETVDLAGVVTDAIRRGTPNGVRITVGGMQAATVEAVETHLERITTNLVDNALRHARTTVEVAVLRQDGHAVLTVADDGPGIPMHQRDRIWERFVRIEPDRSRASGGTGLGLALVRELIEAHAGSVTISQAEDLGGAQFVVRLPLSPRLLASSRAHPL